jgi:hypothetical protein
MKPNPSTKPFRKWEERLLSQLSVTGIAALSIRIPKGGVAEPDSRLLRIGFRLCIVPTQNDNQLLRYGHKD